MTASEVNPQGAAIRYETSNVQPESGSTGGSGALDGLRFVQPHYPPFSFERWSVREPVSNARGSQLQSPRKETA